MIAFPSMLVSAAKKAGIDTPDNPDEGSIDDFKDTHKRFWMFCMVQLARPMSSWSEHWDNADVIAELEESELETVTINDLIEKGLTF